MKTLNLYIDEAGRGPLAGPMYIGIILPLKKLTAKELSLFCDSKKLSESKREEHYSKIQLLQDRKKLIALSASVSAKEIDTYGMTIAQHIAISRGLIEVFQQLLNEISPQIEQGICKIDDYYSLIIQNLLSQKKMSYEHLISIIKIFYEQFQLQYNLVIDGNKDFWLWKTFPLLKIQTIIDGDDKVKEIWMASIIAKVSRDRVMNSLPKKYQKYGFQKHKGYGTLVHRNAIKEFWVSNIHRKLFLKELFPNHKIQKALPKYL